MKVNKYLEDKLKILDSLSFSQLNNELIEIYSFYLYNYNEEYLYNETYLNDYFDKFKLFYNNYNLLKNYINNLIDALNETKSKDIQDKIIVINRIWVIRFSVISNTYELKVKDTSEYNLIFCNEIFIELYTIDSEYQLANLFYEIIPQSSKNIYDDIIDELRSTNGKK